MSTTDRPESIQLTPAVAPRGEARILAAAGARDGGASEGLSGERVKLAVATALSDVSRELLSPARGLRDARPRR